jgi:hypothetical protein
MARFGFAPVAFRKHILCGIPTAFDNHSAKIIRDASPPHHFDSRQESRQRCHRKIIAQPCSALVVIDWDEL